MRYWHNVLLFLDNLLRDSFSSPTPGPNVPGVVTPEIKNIFMISPVINSSFALLDLEVKHYELVNDDLLIYKVTSTANEAFSILAEEIPI